jgi:uncharacterized membrane protein
VKLSTRSIVIIGMLGAISIVLGQTGLGLIPVPTPAGRATILHIPAILAGILEGPVVGAFVGLIFGIYSFLTAPSALAADPIVSIVPRLFIGVVSYYVYKFAGKNIYLSSALAAIAGTATNTVGFLGLGVLQGYIPSWYVAMGIATVHGVPEAVLAVLIVVVLVKAFKKSNLI